MQGKRWWRGPDDEAAEAEDKHTAYDVSDDEEEDANADLSMAILAKASQRPPLVSGPIVLSDDEQPSAPISIPSPLTELSPLPVPSPPVFELVALPRASKKQKIRNKKKRKKASETEAELNGFKDDTFVKIIADDEEDNLEMRQLSRGPRYFDPPDSLCFRCGNSGHFAVDCTEDARKKACFLCGGLDHEVKDCPQSVCLICQGSGHFSRSCPKKHIYNSRVRERGSFCLRCGSIGHEMSACDREYDPEDLKGIQCYICKRYGHLCCVDVALTSERQDTCYNCGDVGHTGVGCAKSRGHLDDDKFQRSGCICFRCGEEGHFARGCSKRNEYEELDDIATPIMGFQPAVNDFQGFRSVPAVVTARDRWQKLEVHDRRANTPPVRWPERWNMEGGERWNRGRYDENEKYRFRPFKFLDDTRDFGSPSHWGSQTPKKGNKQKRARGGKERGKSPSSGGGGGVSRRFWRKWMRH